MESKGIVVTGFTISINTFRPFWVKVSMKDKNGIKLQAPEGKFRLVGMDTFGEESWVYADYDNLLEAKNECSKQGGTMLKAYLYDDKGNCIEEAGSY